MKISKLDAQELNHQEMIKLNGGEGGYFKPAIDGSMLANERVNLLKRLQSEAARKPSISNDSHKCTFLGWLLS